MSKKCRGGKTCVDTRYMSFLSDTPQNSQCAPLMYTSHQNGLYTSFLCGPQKPSPCTKQNQSTQVVCKPNSLSEIPTGSMVITDAKHCVGYTPLVQASTQAYTGAPNPLQPYVRVGNSIIPSAHNTYDLGAVSQRFRAGYFGAAGIDISGLAITVSGDTLILPIQTRLANGTPVGSGGGGSNTDLGLEWIKKNLIGKSPLPQFGTVTVRSSEIYIPWAYPDQIRLTFMDAWVPGITALSGSITYNRQGFGTQTEQILLNADGSRYVDICGNRFKASPPPSDYITGIILTNVPGTIPQYVSAVTFPDGSVRNAYRFYHPDFSALSTGALLSLTLWYNNYGTQYDPATITFGRFTPAGPPSAPRNLQQAGTQAYTIQVVYQPPQYTDISDTTSTATITEYTILYSSPGSTRRYPGPIATAQQTVLTPTLSSLLANLTPDTVYSVDVAATNSAGLTGVYETASLQTSPLQAPALAVQPSIPSGQFINSNNIRRVRDNALITNLLLPTATTVATQAFHTGIHSVTSRGSTAQNIASTTASINGITSTLFYNGFPYVANTSISSQGGIAIQGGPTSDTYSDSVSQGFYLSTPNTVTVDLNTVGVLPSPDINNLEITVSQYDTNGGPVAQTITYPLTFYYDSQPSGAPSILSASVVRNNGVFRRVSGISLLGSGDVKVTADVSNMGKYFYIDPMATVSAQNGLLNSTLTLADIKSGFIGDSLNGTITFEKAVNIQMSSTTYATSIAPSFAVNNTLQSTSTSAITSVSVMIDQPSYQLVHGSSPYYASSPADFGILGIGDHTKIGYRISSGTSRAAAGNFINPYVTEFTDPVIQYDHDVDITNTEELQLSRGKYCTPLSGSSYQNYTSTYDNTGRNYNTIPKSGYRFATFYWDFGGCNFGDEWIGLTFALQGLDSPMSRNIAGSAYVGGERILLYYRFVEDITQPEPTDINTMTTLWIDGNKNELSVSSQNFVSHNNNTQTRDGLMTIDETTNQTECVFYVKLPTYITKSCRLYCRVGLPMSQGVAFRNISATIIVR